MGTRRRYKREFKLEAAKLVVERGYSYREAASQLDTTPWSIRDWVKKFRAEGILSGKENPVPEAEEMKRLRKENADLRITNEILKKATAYFAKESQ